MYLISPSIYILHKSIVISAIIDMFMLHFAVFFFCGVLRGILTASWLGQRSFHFHRLSRLGPYHPGERRWTPAISIKNRKNTPKKVYAQPSLCKAIIYILYIFLYMYIYIYILFFYAKYIVSSNFLLLFFLNPWRENNQSTQKNINNFPVVGGKPLQAFRLQALLWRMLACCNRSRGVAKSMKSMW